MKSENQNEARCVTCNVLVVLQNESVDPFLCYSCYIKSITAPLPQTPQATPVEEGWAWQKLRMPWTWQEGDQYWSNTENRWKDFEHSSSLAGLVSDGSLHGRRRRIITTAEEYVSVQAKDVREGDAARRKACAPSGKWDKMSKKTADNVSELASKFNHYDFRRRLTPSSEKTKTWRDVNHNEIFESHDEFKVFPEDSWRPIPKEFVGRPFREELKGFVRRLMTEKTKTGKEGETCSDFGDARAEQAVKLNADAPTTASNAPDSSDPPPGQPSRPKCGQCGCEMTPQNSKLSPEFFLCDRCLGGKGYAPGQPAETGTEEGGVPNSSVFTCRHCGCDIDFAPLVGCNKCRVFKLDARTVPLLTPSPTAPASATPRARSDVRVFRVDLGGDIGMQDVVHYAIFLSIERDLRASAARERELREALTVAREALHIAKFMVENELCSCELAQRQPNAWPDLLDGRVSGGGIINALAVVDALLKPSPKAREEA